jgi:hypothetical protein
VNQWIKPKNAARERPHAIRDQIAAAHVHLLVGENERLLL